MRIFRGTFRRDEDSPDRPESVRWSTVINEVPFKLYINRGRIPRVPPPLKIEVSIFADEKKLYHRLLVKVGGKCVSQLTNEDKVELHAIDLAEDQLQIAGADAIFGAAFKPVKGHSHTKTMRYNGSKKELEFGDPYIPQSILRDHSPHPPQYLLFLVRWIDEHVA